MIASERGAALIVVIGAISALTVPATLLLLGASIAYEIEAYSTEIAQARELARAARLQTERAVAAGELPTPTLARPVEVLNGVIGSTGAPTRVGRFPSPPMSPAWPPLTDSPPGGVAPSFGIGARATLTAVTGPRGELRDLSGVSDGTSFLVDLALDVWFRRARVQTSWRYRWRDDRLERLD